MQPFQSGLCGRSLLMACDKRESSPLTVVRHVWDLEPFAAVPLVGPELYPEPFGAGGEGDGTLVSLTRLVGGHGIGKSCYRGYIYMSEKGAWGCGYTVTKT